MPSATLLQACVDDSLTPDQSEALVEVFEAEGVPLLFDDLDKRILWPGSEGYKEWASESPMEAAEDEGVSALCVCGYKGMGVSMVGG